jgi:hypothetical protein
MRSRIRRSMRSRRIVTAFAVSAILQVLSALPQNRTVRLISATVQIAAKFVVLFSELGGLAEEAEHELSLSLIRGASAILAEQRGLHDDAEVL